ncbi:MAG: methyltransferase domain-containing protein [Thermomicrobiales bacterium]
MTTPNQQPAEGSRSPREWNAGEYHRLSNPHVDWGTRVLARLPLRGDETILDAGCGTGRLTAQLLDRLPGGHVIAMDRSANMLAEAEAFLRPTYGDRVSFLEADLIDFTLPEPVDVIFSTATFHWVLDHDALFTRLHHSLVPGGRLLAQCGGGPNLARLMTRHEEIAREAPYRDTLADWPGPWEFASADLAAERLARAGFTEIETSIEEAPTILADAPTYREFLRTVILRAHLDRVADPAAREAMLDRLTDQAAADDPAFFLDYWRLNLSGRRPA